jgi:uncharacterized protein YdhG (YjbR/CyaY superfamily)
MKKGSSKRKASSKKKAPSRKKATPASDTASAASRVRSYLSALPPDARRRLTKVRSTIRDIAPGAVDHFSYGIPGFRLEGQPLVWYAAFAHHTSMYPLTPGMRRECAAELEEYETSKGTVRFPLSEALPIDFVKRLVKARVAEIQAASKAGA